MDPFAAVLIVGFIVFVIAIVLLGVYYPGSGLEQLGLKTARQITETREELDALDLDQMLSAHNKRRAARGEHEVTADDMERRVMGDVAEQQRRRDAYLADAELDQLLAATNERRRRRGLPERSREQAREELGGPAPRAQELGGPAPRAQELGGPAPRAQELGGPAARAPGSGSSPET